MKPTIPDVLDKLVAQGSPDQIALFLEQQGIKAIPSIGDRCAIADYVRGETGLSVTVTPNSTVRLLSAETGEVVVVAIDGWVKVGLSAVRLPSVLSELAIKFDKREYPNLIWRKP